MRLLLPYREKEKASFGPASFTPYHRLISYLEKLSPWLETASVDLYVWARSIDFCAKQLIADIPYFPPAGRSQNVGVDN